MANPESVEQMQIVVDSLRNNPDIVIAGGIENNYLQTGSVPRPNGYWSRTLDIYTHPVKPIYDSEELNDFMYGLVPELEPTCSDRFRGYQRSLELGKLYFDETIGTVAAITHSVKLKEGLSVVRAGLLEPEWEATTPEVELRQRTWVRVYPDAGHAADGAEGHNHYSIPREELGRRGRGQIVAALLESPMLGQVIDIQAIEA